MSYLLRFARECASAVGVVVSAIYPPKVREWEDATEEMDPDYEPPAGEDCGRCYDGTCAAHVKCQAGNRFVSPLRCTKPFGHVGEHHDKGCYWPESVAIDPDSAVGAVPTGVTPPAAQFAGCPTGESGDERDCTCDVPAGGEATPPEAVAPPAGLSFAQWIEPAIQDVLATHTPMRAIGYTKMPIYCADPMHQPHTQFDDWHAWREHTAALIAERIETCCLALDPVGASRAADLRIAEALKTFEQHQKK